jgi:hypothetical protein
MRPRLIYATELLVLGILTLAAAPALAQTTAVGPYYATPSWDQKLACASTSNCPRFIVLSNWSSQAVLDRETGLVWQRSPSAVPAIWEFAANDCIHNTTGNRMGWRLPTIQELATLVDPTENFLPAGHPFSNLPSQVANYWSATSSAFVGNFAWSTNLDPQGFSLIPKNFQLFVWCVRGGQSLDVQF